MGQLLHGPNYGIIVRFQDNERTFEDVLNPSIELYQSVVTSLPGFQTAIYHHHDNHYGAVYAFKTEQDADAALAKLKPLLESRVPGMLVMKADVRTGEQMAYDN